MTIIATALAISRMFTANRTAAQTTAASTVSSCLRGMNSDSR